MNLSGVNANPNFKAAWSEVDDIAQFNAISTGTSVSGILDENDLTNLVSDAPLSGNYIPRAAANGNGSISVTTNGALIGGLSLVYYVVDSSTVLFIENDSSQVAVGVFEAQTSGSGETGQSLAAHLSVFHAPTFFVPPQQRSGRSRGLSNSVASKSAR